jgi:hypothetical protein
METYAVVGVVSFIALAYSSVIFDTQHRTYVDNEKKLPQTDKEIVLIDNGRHE